MGLFDKLRQNAAERKKEKEEADILKKEILAESREAIKQELREQIVKEEVDKVRTRQEGLLKRAAKNFSKEAKAYFNNMDMDKKMSEMGSSLPRQYRPKQSHRYRDRHDADASSFPNLERFMKSKRRF